MGSLYKPRIYIPLPEGAEVFEAEDAKGKLRKFARWRDEKGKTHKGRLNRNGDKVAVGESAKWSIAFDDYDPETGRPRRREISGIPDVATARELLHDREREAYRRKHGLIDPLEEALARNERLPIEDHLGPFSDVLEGGACTRRHIETTLAYVRHLCGACGFKTPADISAPKVSGYVADLRKGRVSIRKFKTPRTTSHRTINAVLTAAKRFSRWLYIDKRLRRDPLAEVKKLNVKKDRRHERRALTDDEIDRLIAAARSGPAVFGVSGRDRAMVYRVAIGTGLRASELRSLTPESFDLADLADATVSIKGAYSKSGESVELPVRRDLAEAVAAHVADLPAGERIFRLPQKTAAMIRKDLEAAGIPYRDTADHVADFHALRHTFITRLARSGIAPSVAKDLARHSSIVLTIDHYTHTLLTEKRAALERLPSIRPAAADDSMAATGTEDARPAKSLRRAQRAHAPEGPSMSLPVPIAREEASSAEDADGPQITGEGQHLPPPVANCRKWALLESNQRPGDYENTAEAVAAEGCERSESGGSLADQLADLPIEAVARLVIRAAGLRKGKN